ncbi:MAG TPA: hypothetical protein VK675_03890 [Candidatus Paceibacterota bacterium]|nr:hypothetical protein [Candidatus Paceibacterota bacterium]
MDFNSERYIRGAEKTKAESYEADLREMDSNVDLFQTLGYDKLYKREFEKYEYIVDTTRVVCSEIVELEVKKGLSHKAKKLDQLLREYKNLSAQEFKLKVFFQNVKSFPLNEPKADE